MIRLAEEKDIPGLKSLWRDVFQEEEAYLDAFFEKVFKGDNGLLYETDGRIAAALHMVPYSIIIEEVEHHLLYLYAIGTLPEYRGRGFARAITLEALQIGKDRGYSGAFLVPAEKSLFAWYEGMGFESAFEKTRIEINLDQFPAKEGEGTWEVLDTSNLDKIWKLYQKSPFYQENWVRLTRKQNDFFLDELFRTGGKAMILGNKESNHYALLQQEEENLVVYETTIGSKELPDLLDWARKQEGIHRVTLHQPLCLSEREHRENSSPFAMFFPLKKMTLNQPGINRVLM